jgi:hypothetical protein
MGGNISGFNYTFKGIYRKEHTLYPIPKPISKDELVLFKELLQTILGDGI